MALFTVGPVQAAPGIPQTLQPADGKLNVAKNPTLEISCNDPLVVAAQFVIATDSIFANLVYDSFETVNDLCSHVALAQLNTQTQYHWRARVKDQLGDWSDWSSSRSFTTNSLSAPFFNVFQDGVANYSGTRDADIRGSFQDPTQAIRNWNQGAQNVLRTGRRRDGSTTDEIYRSLLKFDVSELSNKNAVITAYIEMTGWEHGPKPDNPDFDGANSMFEVIRGWGEGQSLENTPPANGEVSWISSTHPNQWSIPGAAHASNSDSSADRKATPLVKMVVTNQVGYKTIWSSKNLVDLVKSWIEQPNQNDGVLIQADDESIQMNLSLASREHVDPAFRPRLVVVSTEEAFLAQNHPPFAIRDSAETQSNVQISIPVLANDFDQDSSPASLFIDSVTAPENGTTNMVGSEIAYLPNQGFLGVDKFFYAISDGQDKASAVVSVLVTSETPVNQPPIAINDQIGVLFETPIDVNVLNNDSDSSGIDVGSVLVTSSPTNGTTSVDTTIGIITYTPNAGYLGIDSFLYTVADVEGLVSNVATVSVIVAEAGTRVTAGLAVYYPLTTGSGNIVHDQSLVGTPMELTLSGNVAWGPGAQGLVFSGGAAQSSGPATKLIDALQLTNQSTIEVWIQPANTTQTGPTRIVSIGGDASKQNFVLGQQQQNVQVRLLHTAKDNQGKPRLETLDNVLTTELMHVVHIFDGTTERVYVNGVENPTTVALSGTYSTWDGTDPLTLGNEGDGTRPWGGTMRMMAAYDRALSLAEVHQNFTSGPPGAGSGGSGNQAPVANNDSASTVQNVPIVVVAPGVLGNDTDGNNDPLTAVLDANPSNGTVSLQTDGSYTYTPNGGFTGPDSFTYHAHDGTLDSNVVMVTLTINGNNSAPVAINDTGTTPLNTAVVINVLANDTDDGVINPVSVAVQSSASNGLTSVNGSTGAITYTPNISYVGSDSFSYTVADTLGLTSNVATVTVTVAGSTTLSFSNITSSTNTGGPSTFGGHGVQFADVTGDDRPDFYVTMNLQPTDMAELFYRNNNGTSFPEEANTRGIANFDTGSHGGVWADLDNDGDYDLFNGSYNQNRVYRNNGTGTFADMTSGSGLPTQEWETRGVTAFDMDQDGDLDLFAVTGFQGTNDPSGERNEVYRNDGNFNFTSIQTGTLYTAPAGQGVTDVDYDGDGDIDLWAANRTGDVNILRNNGDGSFTLVDPSTLGITHRARDGITFADFNNDGALDVLLADFYYLNDGDNTYTFQQQFSAPGYMGGVEDLDNDGDWDVVFAGDNNVFLNNGSGGFTASP
ncbi:MAG: Ig-like domain-containing protein, partial [Nitrospirae bacterium]|nr:Ig-like domain-containing protein [Nitrospirota bacterium]